MARDYVYKVCSISDGRYTSWSQFVNGCAYYALGETTKPKVGDGPLAAFTNKKDAIYFACRNDSIHWRKSHAILKCRFTPSDRKVLSCRSRICLSMWTQGTILCESITPYELVAGVQV